MLNIILNKAMEFCGVVFFGSLAILLLLLGFWSIVMLIKSIKHDLTCPHGQKWFGNVDDNDY